MTAERADRTNDPSRARRTVGAIGDRSTARSIDEAAPARSGAVMPGLEWAQLRPDDRPFAEALGRQVRALRVEAGLTQRRVAALAAVHESTVGRIERGDRRSRRSTLERVARALVDEHRVPAIVDELCEVAGPSLAPESNYAERVARRRERRELAGLPQAIAATKASLRTLRELTLRKPSPALVASLERDLERFERRLSELRGHR